MLTRYIIYYKPFDQFISSHRGGLVTSEFPEEYEVFDTIESAQMVIDELGLVDCEIEQL